MVTKNFPSPQCHLVHHRESLTQEPATTGVELFHVKQLNGKKGPRLAQEPLELFERLNYPTNSITGKFHQI